MDEESRHIPGKTRFQTIAYLVILAMFWGCEPPRSAGKWSVPPEFEAFRTAIILGDLEETDRILVNAPNLTSAYDESGFTALHWALFCRKTDHVTDFIEMFLVKGALIDARSRPSKITPLHFAVECENMEAAKLLLEHGANPRLKTADGETPLDVARREQMDELIRIIEDSEERV